jgi:hypothetical protein
VVRSASSSPRWQSRTPAATSAPADTCARISGSSAGTVQGRAGGRGEAQAVDRTAATATTPTSAIALNSRSTADRNRARPAGRGGVEQAVGQGPARAPQQRPGQREQPRPPSARGNDLSLARPVGAATRAHDQRRRQDGQDEVDDNCGASSVAPPSVVSVDVLA